MSFRFSHIALGLAFLGISCSATTGPANPPAGETQLSAYLDTLLANGFDFPFGDGDGNGSYTGTDGKKYEGWYIATKTAEEYSLGIHTGEDWNGIGGGNTDMGQPVYATAKGMVISAKDEGSPWGNVVLLRHVYIDNGKVQEVFSLYAHLETISVKKGETVERRKPIGTVGTGGGAYPAHLHFEMRKATMKDFEPTYWPSNHGKTVAWVKANYHNPSAFIKDHRHLELPAEKEQLLIAIKHKYKIYLLRKGVKEKEYDIALSQSPLGHKEKQGDNKLPEGAYRIIQKSQGPFSGSYAAYFGPAWMRINYPNNEDARIGYEKGLISKTELESIRTAHAQQKEPPKNTALGGGIGIHGWDGNWPMDYRHLTWGCISMRNSDLPDLYKRIKLETEIYISP